MATKDLKSKDEKELQKELGELRLKLQDFRFGMTHGKTRNTKSGSNLKKEIARILTEINSRVGSK